MAAHGYINYAGFWRRGAAYSIDLLIIILIDIFIATFFESYINPFYWITSILIGVGYDLYFLRKYNATPGKILIGLRIISTNSTIQGLDSSTIITRYIGSIFSGLLLGFGFFIQPFNKQKKTMHDFMSGTAVIDVDKKNSWIIWASNIFIFLFFNFLNSPFAPTANTKAKNEFDEWVFNKIYRNDADSNAPSAESEKNKTFSEK